jgi:hypothetical protein
MTFRSVLILASIGLAAVIIGYLVAAYFFSDEAILERRRRRSNSRIASKRKGPMVKFSVRTPKAGKE